MCYYIILFRRIRIEKLQEFQFVFSRFLYVVQFWIAVLEGVRFRFLCVYLVSCSFILGFVQFGVFFRVQRYFLLDSGGQRSQSVQTYFCGRVEFYRFFNLVFMSDLSFELCGYVVVIILDLVVGVYQKFCNEVI